MYKYYKNKKGITLMSLVVTIILMFILASITIGFVFQDDGIINKTEQARSKYYIADKKECIQNAYTDLITKLEFEKKKILTENSFKKMFIDNVKENSDEKYDIKNEIKIEGGYIYITLENNEEMRFELPDQVQEKNTNTHELPNEPEEHVTPENDNEAPVVEINSTTMDSITYDATDNGRVTGFFVSTSNIPPSASASGWTTNKTVTGLKKDATYYIFAKDEAGNVSEGVEATTSHLARVTLSCIKEGYINSYEKEIKVEADSNNYSKIRYTTDGKDPTTQTQTTVVKGGKISVTENCTVRAAAFDAQGQRGEIASCQVGWFDKTAPVINSPIQITETSTDSITARVEVTDQYSGYAKVEWFYKLSSEEDYEAATTYPSEVQINGNEKGSTQKQVLANRFSNLKSGTYDLKVVVYDVAGNKATSETTAQTALVDPASGATATPATYTNGNVTITLPTKTGFTTVYSTEGIPTISSTVYNENNEPTATANTTYYYAYSDGENVGAYGTLNINNIDKTAPTINTQLNVTANTTTSKTVSINLTDSGSGLGKITWYKREGTSGSWVVDQDEIYATLNGVNNGIMTGVTKTHTFSGLNPNSQYYFYAVVYDVAGNSTSGSYSANNPLNAN